MRFHTADLLSKWGFDDGDLIDNFLESHNFPIDIIDTSPLWERIFTQLVLPEIENDLTFEWTPSMHNGARAKTVDGNVIDHTAEKHPDVHVRPEYVDVPDHRILQWANELRDDYLAIPRSTIQSQMASGCYSQVSEAFTALQVKGICDEDHDMISATCADERLDESLRRRIGFELSRAQKDA